MAVEQSVAQMALTRDVGPGGFMERVTAILALTGGSVLWNPGRPRITRVERSTRRRWWRIRRWRRNKARHRSSWA